MREFVFRRLLASSLKALIKLNKELGKVRVKRLVSSILYLSRLRNICSLLSL